MAPSDFLGETWPELCARLGAERLYTWAASEPTLAHFADLQTLAVQLQASPDLDWVDEVFGALLRLAAADHGDDRDAGLVVAHLMHKASRALAVSLADLSTDIDVLVAAELWVQIRSYRWQHRRRGHALGLKQDTRDAVLGEVRPSLLRDKPDRAVPAPPEVVSQLIAARADGAPAAAPAVAAGDAEDELLDLLAWARDNDVITDEDVDLLLEFELASLPDRHATAAARGVHERTLRRRCNRAKTRLHDARLAYLAQAA